MTSVYSMVHMGNIAFAINGKVIWQQQRRNRTS